jgi:tetratricopeptide (TPR) repeat protein
MGIGSYLHWQDAETKPVLVDALERSRRVLGEKHPQTAGLMTGLAVAYSNLNELDKAEEMAQHCVELRRSVLGDEHPLTTASILILARVYILKNEIDKAETLTSRALELTRNFRLENNPFLIWHYASLGWHNLELGRVTQADTLCDLAYQSMRRNPEVNPMANPRVLAYLGAVRLAEQRYAEAEPLLREALQLAEKHWPDSGHRYYVMSLLGGSLAGQAKYFDAEPLLVEGFRGLELHRATLPPYVNPSRRVKESIQRVEALYGAWGKPAQAAEWKKRLDDFAKAKG